VTPAGRGAQALLRQEGDAPEPCGVIGQDVGAVGVGGDQPAGRGCRPPSLCEQRSAVSRGTRDGL
jgi:hypothetical protein